MILSLNNIQVTNSQWSNSPAMHPFGSTSYTNAIQPAKATKLLYKATFSLRPKNSACGFVFGVLCLKKKIRGKPLPFDSDSPLISGQCLDAHRPKA